MKKLKISLLSLLGLLFIASQLTAQNCPARPTNHVAGGFIAPAVTCVGQPLSVTNLAAGATNLKYTYNFVTLADTSKAVATTTFTYNTAGRYLLVQTGLDLQKRRIFQCQVVTVTTTPKPTFTVTSCGNGTGRVTINTAGLAYNVYQINWGDGSAVQAWQPNQPALTHSFPRAGAYRIVVSGQTFGSTCVGTSDPVNLNITGTTPTLPVWVSADVIDDATVEMVFQTPPGNTNTYVLQQRILPSTIGTNVMNPNFTAAGANQTRARATGLRVSQTTYGYVLSVVSQCAGTAISISSQDIGIVSLTVNAQAYQNQLTWRPFTSPGLINFLVLRDGATIASLASNQFNYTDTKVNCGQKYNYQVVATYNRTPMARSSSRKIDVTTLPTTPPPMLTNVSVNVRNESANQLSIVMPVPNPVRIKEYFIKSSSGFNYRGTRTLVTDSLAKPTQHSDCYIVNYVDACGRIPKDSVVVCALKLDVKGDFLQWNEDSPFNNRVASYSIESLDAQGRVIATYAANRDIEWDLNKGTNNQEVTYRVRARSITGVTAVSNTVKVYRPMKIFAPDAFTPNGDGNNETFAIQGIFIKSAGYTVFNRLGQPIFQTTDYKKGWKGLDSNGALVPVGLYGYIIEAIDSKNNTIKQRGSVQVLY